MATTYTIRIHAIPLTDADGGRACKVTAPEFAEAVAGVNEIYAPADIRFDFNPDRDWHPRRDTSLNSLQNGGSQWWKEANRVAAKHRGRLVVFLRWGNKMDKPASNWFAYPPDTGQAIPPSVSLPTANVDFVATGNQTTQFENSSGVFAHEIGHYLGLFHTHPGWGFTATDTIRGLVTAAGRAGLDGDLLSDTPPDPGVTYYRDEVSTDICGGPASFTIDGRAFSPDRSNVMSYFRCPPVRFSPQQIAVMRQTLRHRFRKHLIETNLGIRYSGVFRQATGGQALWVGDDWDGFTDTWRDLSNQGQRLVDLETYVIGGRRRFAGVFRPGTGKHALYAIDNWTTFTDTWKRLSGEGMRLIDFETWTQGSKRHYAGVFRAGSGKYALYAIEGWKPFTDKWRELTDDGLRLINFETWIQGGKRHYAGVFRAGRDAHALFAFDDWKAFTDKWKELSSDGLRLIDFETWTQGRRRHYAGVFRAGTNEYALWHNDDWFGFNNKVQELRAEGMHLVDLEVFGSKVS